jgi:hypothetical protein
VLELVALVELEDELVFCEGLVELGIISPIACDTLIPMMYF